VKQSRPAAFTDLLTETLFETPVFIMEIINSVLGLMAVTEDQNIAQPHIS
jgi:uncharacterized membrane protein YGL010W